MKAEQLRPGHGINTGPQMLSASARQVVARLAHPVSGQARAARARCACCCWPCAARAQALRLVSRRLPHARSAPTPSRRARLRSRLQRRLWLTQLRRPPSPLHAEAARWLHATSQHHLNVRPRWRVASARRTDRRGELDGAPSERRLEAGPRPARLCDNSPLVCASRQRAICKSGARPDAKLGTWFWRSAEFPGGQSTRAATPRHRASPLAMTPPTPRS